MLPDYSQSYCHKLAVILVEHTTESLLLTTAATAATARRCVRASALTVVVISRSVWVGIVVASITGVAP